MRAVGAESAEETSSLERLRFLSSATTLVERFLLSHTAQADCLCSGVLIHSRRLQSIPARPLLRVASFLLSAFLSHLRQLTLGSLPSSTHSLMV